MSGHCRQYNIGEDAANLDRVMQLVAEVSVERLMRRRLDLTMFYIITFLFVQAWKNLPPDGKALYEERARLEVQKYLQEERLYEMLLVQYNQLLQSARENPSMLIQTLENGLPLVEGPLGDLIQRCSPHPARGPGAPPARASPWAGQYDSRGGHVANHHTTHGGGHANGVHWSTGQSQQPAVYSAHSTQATHRSQHQGLIQNRYGQGAALTHSAMSGQWNLEPTHSHHDRPVVGNQSGGEPPRLPPKIRVSCLGLRGTMLPKEALILCICPACATLPDSKRTFSCRGFCAHAGGPVSGQGWQTYIKIPPGGAPDVSITTSTGVLLGQWLESHGIDSNHSRYNKSTHETSYRASDLPRSSAPRISNQAAVHVQSMGNRPQVVSAPVAQPQAASTPYTPWRDGLEGNFTPIDVRWAGDRCSICDTDTDYDSDQLIMCDMCGITVHQSCYGVNDLPEMDEEWLCRSCEAQKDGEAPPQCCLCPVTGGALKPTIISGVWCHVVCLQWIPEVTVDDMEAMEPVRGIRSIPKDRWELVCCFCKQRMGAKIQCDSCYTAYHPLCGRIAGLHMEMVEAEGKMANARHKGTEEEVVYAVSYCARHGPTFVQYGIRKVEDKDEYGLMEMPERWDAEGSGRKSSPGQLFNGQPYPFPEPAPLPPCPAPCARAAPLDEGRGWVRRMHGTGSGAITEVGFWIPSFSTKLGNTIGPEKQKDGNNVDNGADEKPANDEAASNGGEGAMFTSASPSCDTKTLESAREKRRKLRSGSTSGGTDSNGAEDIDSGAVSLRPAGKHRSMVEVTRPPVKFKSLNVVHHQQQMHHSEAARGLPRGHVGLKDPKKDLVGRWARMWWPEDQEWYVASVREYSSLRGQHRVWYEIDRESEWVDLTEEERKGYVQYLPGEDRDSWPPALSAPETKRFDKDQSVVNLSRDNGPFGTVFSSRVPKTIDVVCNELRGILYLQRSVVRLKNTGEEVSPTEFERLAGRGAAKKWKISVRVDSPGQQGMTIEAWMASMGIEDSGYRHTSRSLTRSVGPVSVAPQARPTRQRRQSRRTAVSDFRSNSHSVPARNIRTVRTDHFQTQEARKRDEVVNEEESTRWRWGKRAYLQAVAHTVSVGAASGMPSSCPPSRCWKPSDWAVHRLWHRHITESTSGSSGGRGSLEKKGHSQHLLNGLGHFPKSASALVAAIAPLLPSYCDVDGVFAVVEDNYTARVSLGYGVDGGCLNHLSSGRTLTLKDKLKFCVATEFEKVAFGKSGIHGWGLFARIPIRQDTMVIEFRGQVVRRTVADAREKRYLAQGTDCYMFNLDEDVVIDATQCGTVARFTNHSCNPCLYTKIIACDGESKLAFFARTDISPGQELTYDYRFHKAEDDEEKIPCRCGAKNCMRFLN